jgi:hypothetical protein
MQWRALFGLQSGSRSEDVFFALSPRSTRERMAAERVALFAVAHASTLSTKPSGIREVICGSLPVAADRASF